MSNHWNTNTAGWPTEAIQAAQQHRVSAAAPGRFQLEFDDVIWVALSTGVGHPAVHNRIWTRDGLVETMLTIDDVQHLKDFCEEVLAAATARALAPDKVGSGG